jgi:hypothetical protein
MTDVEVQGLPFRSTHLLAAQLPCVHHHRAWHQSELCLCGCQSHSQMHDASLLPWAAGKCYDNRIQGMHEKLNIFMMMQLQCVCTLTLLALMLWLLVDGMMMIMIMHDDSASVLHRMGCQL